MRHGMIALLFLIGFAGVAQKRTVPPSALVNDSQDTLGVNRMLMYMSNNGGLSHNPVTGGPGLEWLRGSGQYLAYVQGLIWGGKINDAVHVGGSTYNRGWQAGVILPDGSADDAEKPEHRIYRAHRFDAAWWQTLSRAEQSQYLQDLREWPAQQGAPWMDANANGVYDPDTAVWTQGGVTDTPDMRGDEMVWFANNAMDADRMHDLYGSQPAPIEMHTLIWASSGHPLLDDVILREHTLINKGDTPVEEMSIGMWDDADLGEPFDDYCGIDTALGLAYAWNGLSEDGEYGIPPASGTVWLQTPVVPQPGSTARWGDASRADYANMPVSGFVYYIGASSIYSQPQLKSHAGAIQMNHNLAGKASDGTIYVDPMTGKQTRLLLSGDPVRGRGWIDGIVNPPGDRVFLSSCGTFTLAPGDTQKVVFASLAADGENQFLSVRTLRRGSRRLHDIHRNLTFSEPAPDFTSSISYPGQPGVYQISVSGGPFPSGTTKVEAVLRDPDGMEIQRVSMADDGQHGDGAAGDGIFGGVLNGSGQQSGGDLFVHSSDPGGAKEWFVKSELALPGPVTVRFTGVLLDTPESNGRVEPGEYVRLRLRITNGTTGPLDSLHLFFRGEHGGHVDRAVQRFPLTIPIGDFLEPVYREDEMETYIGMDIPVDAAPGTYTIPVTLMSDGHCTWELDIPLTIDTLPAPPVHGLLAHVEGRASGSLGYTIVRPEALTEHDYRVSIEGEDFGEKIMHVEDVTRNVTLGRYAIPDTYDPLSPEIDGWRINIGTAFDQLVYDEMGRRLPSFDEAYAGEFTAPGRQWFTVFRNGTQAADEAAFGSQATQYDLLPVRLVFDRTAGQKALRYLRGSVPNYGYTGYRDVPLRVYDISDTSAPRQLMIGFNELQGSPANDDTFMPTADPADREFLLIFADDYEEEAPQKFQQPIPDFAPQVDLLYLFWPLRDTTQPIFEDGDSYLITPRIPISKRDVYILEKPKLLTIQGNAPRPAHTALHPVYPNPIGNGSPDGGTFTTVSFTTARPVSVRIVLHDMLGREVATLLDRHVQSGMHRFRSDVSSLMTGTYILRLDAAGERHTQMVVVLR